MRGTAMGMDYCTVMGMGVSIVSMSMVMVMLMLMLMVVTMVVVVVVSMHSVRVGSATQRALGRPPALRQQDHAHPQHDEPGQ